jgi:hypothetical protein
MTTDNICEISCKGQKCVVQMDVDLIVGSSRLESRPGNFPGWGFSLGSLKMYARMVGQYLMVGHDYFYSMPIII